MFASLLNEGGSRGIFTLQILERYAFQQTYSYAYNYCELCERLFPYLMLKFKQSAKGS